MDHAARLAPIARRGLTACLALAMLPALAPRADAQAFEPLRIEGQTILSGSEPVRGLQVLWHANLATTPSQEARDEIRRMRDEFGFTGFTAEIGWNAIEPQEGNYTFPPQIDRVIEIAREEGMWVTLLATPHYTPGWVFSRWGDVKMRNELGEAHDGLWLNFSPSSPPALEAQGRFQRAFIAHYAQHPNILGFHLTNELAYGIAGWVDYSRWAEDTWSRWRAARGLPATTMPRPAEAAARPADWAAFCRFRQDVLNTYFDTLYREAVQGLPRFIPVHHRHLWYAHSDAFASQRGLYLDPNETLGDATGGNVYGTSSVMEAQMQAWQKPIVLTETNVVEGTAPSAGQVNEMFLTQAFAGAQVQFVYHFGPGGVVPIRGNDRRALPAYERLKDLAEVLEAAVGRELPVAQPVGFLWPRNMAAQRSGEFWNLQEPLNAATSAQQRAGLAPVAVYPSFLEPGQAPARLMERIRILYVPRHQGLDQAAVDSARLRDWVAAGGTLVVEADEQSGFPSWAGIARRPTGAASYSAAPALARPFQREPKHGPAFALTVGPGDEVWAAWDRTSEAAVLARPHGSGRVVAIGTSAFNRLHEPAGQALVAELRGRVHPELPAVSDAFDYRTWGPHRLVTPRDRTRPAELDLPATWALGGGTLRFMDRASGEFSAPRAFSPGAQRVSIPAGQLLAVFVSDTTLPPGTLPQVGLPAILARGRVFRAQVTLTCPTPGAELRYTLDGRDPTSSSTAYQGTFTLHRSATVKARGFLAGHPQSAVASQRVSLLLPRGWWRFW